MNGSGRSGRPPNQPNTGNTALNEYLQQFGAILDSHFRDGNCTSADLLKALDIRDKNKLTKDRTERLISWLEVKHYIGGAETLSGRPTPPADIARLKDAHAAAYATTSPGVTPHTSRKVALAHQEALREERGRLAADLEKILRGQPEADRRLRVAEEHVEQLTRAVAQAQATKDELSQQQKEVKTLRAEQSRLAVAGAQREQRLANLADALQSVIDEQNTEIDRLRGTQQKAQDAIVALEKQWRVEQRLMRHAATLTFDLARLRQEKLDLKRRLEEFSRERRQEHHNGPTTVDLMLDAVWATMDLLLGVSMAVLGTAWNFGHAVCGLYRTLKAANPRHARTAGLIAAITLLLCAAAAVILNHG